MTQVPPLQEGSRWRHAKPSSEEVAAWFQTVPLDEGMAHADFISGVVIIPASEKVKKVTERGTQEVWEPTFTPYVRVDTRIAYFRKLAAAKDQVAVIEPVEVPRISEGDCANNHMPPGFWFHVVPTDSNRVRFLCCTMRVALYEAELYYAAEQMPRPSREGTATKQVPGGTDINGLAKAETGAVGRALGMAGILVVGTGVATAEDMQELREPAALALPEAGAPAESEEDMNSRLLALQKQLRPHTQAWTEFSAWWTERARQGGWDNAMEAPAEVRRGMAAKMEGMLAELPETPETESQK